MVSCGVLTTHSVAQETDAGPSQLAVILINLPELTSTLSNGNSEASTLSPSLLCTEELRKWNVATLKPRYPFPWAPMSTSSSWAQFCRVWFAKGISLRVPSNTSFIGKICPYAGDLSLSLSPVLQHLSALWFPLITTVSLLTPPLTLFPQSLQLSSYQ